MNINEISFPLYKLRAYIEIEESPLGMVYITSIHGKYILDDLTYDGIFVERRMQLYRDWPTEEIYKLKEQVCYLRQLVKYKTGSVFIDYSGKIIKYTKNTRLFTVKSYKIDKKRSIGDNWTILYFKEIEQPFLVFHIVKITTKYVSMMETEWGLLLYDLTSEPHKPYKRKI